MRLVIKDERINWFIYEDVPFVIISDPKTDIINPNNY